jgi:hypothetical protein
MNDNDFKTDFYNLMSIDNIKLKYNISTSTYTRIVKKFKLKRIYATKTSRLFGQSINEKKDNIENIKVEDNIKPIITKKPPKKILETVQLDKNEDPYDDIIIQLNNKPDDKQPDDELHEVDNDFLTNILNKSKAKLDKNNIQLQKTKARQALDTKLK